MSLVDKSIELITMADLGDLVSNHVAEGLRIEYKRLLPGGSDHEKKEFLYDVSSFANAHGGLLLYGVSESRGFPVDIHGVALADPDAELARLQNMIRDGIEPRIPGLQVRAIEVEKSQVMVVVRVPRSWALPHRVTFKSDMRFYTRNSNGKHPMDLLELRAAFNLSDSIIDRARRFRGDRLAAIDVSDTPVLLRPGPRTCLHLVPVSAFDPAARFDVKGLAADLNAIRPMYSQGWSYRLNFDGIVGFVWSETGPTYTYVQVYRSGIVEAVSTALLEPEEGSRRIPYIAYEESLIESVSLYLGTQKGLGIQPPILLMLSLQGVKGFTIEPRRPVFPRQQHPIDRDLLCIEAVIEGYEVEAAGLMKPVFDQIWNAAGWEGSLSYTEDGNWQPRG